MYYDYYSYPEQISSYDNVTRYTPRPRPRPRPRPPYQGYQGQSQGQPYMNIDDFKAMFPLYSKVWYSSPAGEGSGTLVQITDNGTATIIPDEGGQALQVTIEHISTAGLQGGGGGGFPAPVPAPTPAPAPVPVPVPPALGGGGSFNPFGGGSFNPFGGGLVIPIPIFGGGTTMYGGRPPMYGGRPPMYGGR